VNTQHFALIQMIGNNYNFPNINNIIDVLPHINNYEEIKVYEKDWYTIINYAVNLQETFYWDEDDVLGSSIRRECRGLIFDTTSGKLLSRPYHKFFNVGEKEETSIDKINLNESHIVLEKLDGSMIRPLPTPDSFRLATKSGITDISEQAEEFIKGKANYNTFISKCIQKNTTPIFEWTSRKNRIVLDYPEDNLILTAIRYNNSGEYTNYEVMMNYATAWNIPVVKAIAGDNETDLNLIVDHIRKWEDNEGVVIRFDSGHLIKIKADDYVLKHKTKEQINLEKNVIQIILDDSVDDLIPLLTENDAKRLKDYQGSFWSSIEELTSDLTEMFNSANQSYPDQKDFSVEFVIKEKLSKPLAGIMYAMRQGRDVKNIILDKIQKSTTSQTKVDETRWLFGNIKWN
jgi:RNA ligase